MPPSDIPNKKYCDITGFKANYTHKSNGLRYFNKETYQWIENNLSSFERQQEVLEIRGAGTLIK